MAIRSLESCPDYYLGHDPFLQHTLLDLTGVSVLRNMIPFINFIGPRSAASENAASSGPQKSMISDCRRHPAGSHVNPVINSAIVVLRFVHLRCSSPLRHAAPSFTDRTNSC